MLVAPEIASAKPYLIRAMYEWCGDQGLTPFVTVFVDEQTIVPMEFVKDGTITLNIGADATGGLLIGSETLEFKARFSGVPRQIVVPLTHVMAIYGRENGQGMAFPISDSTPDAPIQSKLPEIERSSEKKEPIKKPILTRIK
jgi:stringent starvation protein B